MPFADPNSIVIPSDRQRGRTATKQVEPDVESLAASISSRGQIHPIIVRTEGNHLVLVAGERRLLACRKLGLDVEYKLWDHLSPLEAKIVELEENVKRQDLTWRDAVATYGELYDLYAAQDGESWNQSRAAERFNISNYSVSIYMAVYRHLKSPMLAQAQTLDQAFSILQRAADRRLASLVNEITEGGRQAFDPPPSASVLPPAPSTAGETQVPQPNSGPQPQLPPAESRTTGAFSQPASVVATAAPPPQPSAPIAAPSSAPSLPILNVSFLDWAPTYTGPKFNLIHVDFPYGVRYEAFANSINQRGETYSSQSDDYFLLLDCFTKHLSRFASYSSHVVFWFSMTYYAETKRLLESAGLWVQEHPLIWLKSDNAGIVPGSTNEHPRRIYETAFLASRGKRTLIKAFSNATARPTASNAIHPSVKPEPVLREFFAGLVDETTDLFDPTCGSGSALRAAEDCGARSVLGLELNSEFAQAANSLTIRARNLRRATK